MGKWGRTLANLVERLNSVYSGQRILVTGHNGFKGSWLVALLNYLGAEVVGLSLEIDDESPFKNFHSSGTHGSITQDIRDFSGLNTIICDINPNLVFHLAAQPLVLKSYEIPRETFETNVQGTANLLSALNGPNLKGVVVATTDKVYLNDESGREFKEQDQLWGHDPYSLSKTGTELVVDAWRKLSNFSSIPLVTVRAGNVFGPGDRAKDRLFCDLVNSASTGSQLVIRNPQSIRPWQFVLDPLMGYLMVGEAILTGQKVSHSYNFGPSSDSFINVQTFTHEFTKHFPVDCTFEENTNTKESKILKLNSDLAQIELGWTPMTSIEDGLAISIAQELPQIKFENPRILIEDYLNLWR